MDKDSYLCEAALNASSIDNEASEHIAHSPTRDVWLDEVVAPTNLPIQHTNIPDMSLQLQYVYGYNCQTLRGNIKYNLVDDVVFTVASIAVVMNRTTRTQRFFQVNYLYVNNIIVVLLILYTYT
jgi:hypothetical protein